MIPPNQSHPCLNYDSCMNWVEWMMPMNGSTGLNVHDPDVTQPVSGSCGLLSSNSFNSEAYIYLSLSSEYCDPGSKLILKSHRLQPRPGPD